MKEGRFVERHLREFFARHEGMGCWADKARTVMRALLDFFVLGRPISFSRDEKHTFHLTLESLDDPEGGPGFVRRGPPPVLRAPGSHRRPVVGDGAAPGAGSCERLPEVNYSRQATRAAVAGVSGTRRGRFPPRSVQAQPQRHQRRGVLAPGGAKQCRGGSAGRLLYLPSSVRGHGRGRALVANAQ
jgi:hypothetical protein